MIALIFGCLGKRLLLLRMSWKDVITAWLSKEKLIVPNETKLSTTDLADILVEKNMIPAAIRNNAILYEVLLTRILLETLDVIKVPRAPQNPNGYFVYRMNAKEMLLWNMGRKNEEQIRGLEKETGVNLEHYHKLNREKRTFVCAKHGYAKCKCKCEGDSNKKRKLETV